MKLLKSVVCLLVLFSLRSFAQEASPTPPENDDETIKISTALIQLDVTVTDKDGRIVTDLKPEEFEIYENGRKRSITNFSYVAIDKSSIKGNSQTARTDKDSVPIPPVKLKAGQVRRTYALVVDDLGLSFKNVTWLQKSLRKFINEQMQEGDLVAIIKTGASMGALQSFTSDKRLLLAAVDRIKWNAQGRGGTDNFSPISTTSGENLSRNNGEEKSVQKQFDELRNDNFSIGTLGALSYIISGMRELPGRKAVMLFSEGFVLSGEGNRVLNGMRAVADLANRSSVIIYTIDPRGLVNPLMLDAEESISPGIPNRMNTGRLNNNPLDSRMTAFRESLMSLNFLAEETGGFSFINQNNLNKGLLKAIEDQSGYYLLGYEPDEDAFDPKKLQFNKLEVKILRSGLKVRYRSGFFGITDEKYREGQLNRQQKIIAALMSPFETSEINLNLYPIFENDAVGGNFIQALVHIEAKDLQFVQNGDKRKANFDLIAMTFGDNGAPVDRFLKNYSVEVSEKLYQNMLRNGFVYTLPVPIGKPGAYQFRVALRDTVSDKVGSASQFIEVPDIKKKLALSNLLLDNYSNEEWQKVRLSGNFESSEKSPLLDTTLRRFKRETVLRYEYMAYSPKPNNRLESKLRLIKDGKVVYEESPTAITMPISKDIGRVPEAGAVLLGKNLELGSYILQIIVFDKTDSRKFAMQFVEFELVE